MVLRGQPVGEQGAADRWTALDPHVAGSGAGGTAGDPPPRRPLLSPHIVQPRALRGPFSMPRFIFLMPVLSIYWDFAIRGNAGLL